MPVLLSWPSRVWGSSRTGPLLRVGRRWLAPQLPSGLTRSAVKTCRRASNRHRMFCSWQTQASMFRVRRDCCRGVRQSHSFSRRLRMAQLGPVLEVPPCSLRSCASSSFATVPVRAGRSFKLPVTRWRYVGAGQPVQLRGCHHRWARRCSEARAATGGPTTDGSAARTARASHQSRCCTTGRVFE